VRPARGELPRGGRPGLVRRGRVRHPGDDRGRRVAAFNQRAITVYERAGFVETERCRHRTNGTGHDFVATARG